MKNEREKQIIQIDNTPYKSSNIHNDDSDHDNVVLSSFKGDIPISNEIQQSKIYMQKSKMMNEDNNNMRVDMYNTEHFYNQIKRNLMF